MALARACAFLCLALGSQAATLSTEPDLSDLAREEAAQEDDGATEICKCLQWSKVYSEAGQGMTMPCKNGWGGLEGTTFCGFVQKMNSSVCLHQKFQSSERVESGCWVKPACKIAKQGRKNKYAFKTCRKWYGDILLSELPVALIANMARANGVDQSVIAGFSNEHQELLVDDVSEEKLQQVKASNVPTFIWSKKDQYGDRYQVRGNQVWLHKYAPRMPGKWQVTCKEGCGAAAK